MKKIVFLSTKNLDSYILDDHLVLEANQNFQIETLNWEDAADWASYDLVVVRTTWNYTEKRDSFLEKMMKIQESGTQLCNPHHVLEWNSNKKYLKDLESQGCAILPTIFLDEEEFEQKFSNMEGERFVLKPSVGAGAAQIKIENREGVISFFHKIHRDEHSCWFVQPFKDSVLEGEISLMFFNGEFSHAVKKIPKEKDFRVQEEHGASIHPYEPDSKDLLFAQKIISCLGESLLYARVDFLKEGSKRELMELELVEPSLYFRVCEDSAENFLTALSKKLKEQKK